MMQSGSFVTLGDLLGEAGDSEQDEVILERLELLAQEFLPEGWTNWKVTGASEHQVFGERVDPQTFNKLRFALPTTDLAKAFDPEATRLSEKTFRDIKAKLVHWDFTRALILSPPAIANRIHGSAVQTELFNRAIDPVRTALISREEADRRLVGVTDSDREQKIGRKRGYASSSASTRAKKSKSEDLEKRVNDILSVVMERLDSIEKKLEREYPEGDSSESILVKKSETPRSSSLAGESADQVSWRGPSLETLYDIQYADITERSPDLEFLPEVKECEPPFPEPSAQIRVEGIACQRLGSEGWNRIRYKEVEKRLHASPVFSALKVNTELAGLGAQVSPFWARLEGMLGTISHGLLMQRRALAEELRKIASEFPVTAEKLRKLLTGDSRFKAVSDDLLQFVCGHRAEAIEWRRRAFRAKNETLTKVLQQIPPSPTHLFEEAGLSSLLRNHGGIGQVFPSRNYRVSDRRPIFRRSAARSPTPRGPKPKQLVQRTQVPSAARTASGHRSSSSKRGRGDFRSRRATDRRSRDRRY